MMRDEFKGITPEEYQNLTDAIAEITILIAGADGTVHKNEVEWAEKVTKIRYYNLPKRLSSYYKDVGKNIREKLDHWHDRFLQDRKKSKSEEKSNQDEINPIYEMKENLRIENEL